MHTLYSLSLVEVSAANGPPDRHDFLDWVRSHSWDVEKSEHRDTASYPSVLSHHRSKLARGFLEPTRQMGLRRDANWFPDDASLLL